MKKFGFIGIFFFSFFLSSFSQGFYKLDWYDEFNGETLNPAKWDYQLGTGSTEGLQYWGNNEKQYYTKENLRLEDGMLVITAKKESKSGMAYTSSRIFTRGKYATAFGRIEARMALPAGTGLWPAFWMLPQDSPYGTWASSGEVDIMEAKGRLPNEYSGAIHFGGVWPNNQYTTTGDYRFPNNETIEDFHLYAIEWTDKYITWLCDDIVVKKITYWRSDKGEFPAPFDVPFYILFNMAVGGNFDENRMPDSSFSSAEMKVDYVRVYKWDDNLTEPEIPEESEPVDPSIVPAPKGVVGAIQYELSSPDAETVIAKGKCIEPDKGFVTVNIKPSRYYNKPSRYDNSAMLIPVNAVWEGQSEFSATFSNLKGGEGSNIFLLFNYALGPLPKNDWEAFGKNWISDIMTNNEGEPIGIKLGSSTSIEKMNTGFRITRTNSFINIESKIPIREIDVYSLTGNLLTKTSSSSFNTSCLAKGAYIVRVTAIDNLSQSFKIII